MRQNLAIDLSSLYDLTFPLLTKFVSWSEHNMREHAVEDIADKHDETHGAKPAYRVLYDGQCEICPNRYFLSKCRPTQGR